MTHSKQFKTQLSMDEWSELIALKDAINYCPSQVHPNKMELFTAMLVKTLEGKGDCLEK